MTAQVIGSVVVIACLLLNGYWLILAIRWRERFERMSGERDELAVANANLLEERSNWIFENMLMRAELDAWESEAERRVVESQEGTTDGRF